jgi:ketosteroid isomerase-like protein
MKIPVLITIAGLMIGFAAPTFAQQKEPSLTEQDREQILEIGKKNDEAWSKSDATALAALFTVDAVFVTPAGILVGREAIEQRYQTVFKDLEKG